jgi:hypothetical protein
MSKHTPGPWATMGDGLSVRRTANPTIVARTGAALTIRTDTELIDRARAAIAKAEAK